MSRGKNALEVCAIIILFTLLTLFYFHNLLPFKPGAYCNYHDQMLHVWILGWDGWAFLNDPFGIFDANIKYPTPNTLALSDHLLGLMPNWFIGYLISGDYVAAHNWTFLITYIIDGVGIYLFLKYWDIHFAVAFVVAVFFAFNPNSLSIGQIQLSSVGYTFLVFLFLEKYLREGRRKSLIFMALFFILGFLSGFYYAYMLTIAFWIYVIITFLTERKLLSRNKFGAILLTFIVSMLILLPTIYPYIELRYVAHSLSAPKQELIDTSLSLGSSFDSWKRFILGDFYSRLIALIGFVYLVWRGESRIKRGAVIFLTVAVTFHILSLGPYLKIGDKVTGIPLPHNLLLFIPGFNVVRIIERFQIMALVGELLLFALALNLIIPRKKLTTFTMANLVRLAVFLFLLSKIFTLLTPLSKDGGIRLARVPYGDNLPRIYKHLGTSSDSAPIAEFPLEPSLERGNYLYQYFSLFHHRKMFNGYSGHATHGYQASKLALETTQEWVAFLRAIGVGIIVSHPPDYFIQVIERSYQNSGFELIPLPEIDPELSKTVVWMNHVERDIYAYGLRLDKMNRLLGILGADSGAIEYARFADAGRDRIIVDLGHEIEMPANPANYPALPEYAEKIGHVLKVAHRDFKTMMAHLGPNAHSILLHYGINRIEIHGYRYIFREKIKNVFYGMSDTQAGDLGLAKVAEADGSVIWRIEERSEITSVKYPDVLFRVFADNNVIKVAAKLSLKPNQVWKNPNLYGTNEGTVNIRKVGESKVISEKTYFKLPLAVTEHRDSFSYANIEKPLPPGSYEFFLDFPDLSATTYRVMLQIGR